MVVHKVSLVAIFFIWQVLTAIASHDLHTILRRLRCSRHRAAVPLRTWFLSHVDDARTNYTLSVGWQPRKRECRLL